MREHVYFKCDPCKSNGHCMFCDGGLLYCTVCKCGEVELAAEWCPGPVFDCEYCGSGTDEHPPDHTQDCDRPK